MSLLFRVRSSLALFPISSHKMKVSLLTIVLTSSSGVAFVESSPDIVNTCVLVDKPESVGPYEAYSGNTSSLPPRVLLFKAHHK